MLLTDWLYFMPEVTEAGWNNGFLIPVESSSLNTTVSFVEGTWVALIDKNRIHSHVPRWAPGWEAMSHMLGHGCVAATALTPTCVMEAVSEGAGVCVAQRDTMAVQLYRPRTHPHHYLLLQFPSQSWKGKALTSQLVRTSERLLRDPQT